MAPASEKRPILLVVEDDPAHAALIEAALSYHSIPWDIHVTGSSEEAMDYLMGSWPYQHRVRSPLPDVILLDLGLPGMGGLDFLGWFNGRGEAWADIPIIVFTAHEERTVGERATALGAQEVLVKPSGFSELVETISGVLGRWHRRHPPDAASS